jgi:hypothetical protein
LPREQPVTGPHVRNLFAVGFARAAFQVGETFAQIRRTAICRNCRRAKGERLDFCTYGPRHAPRSLLEMQSKIARDHSNHDDDADDVENHCLLRLSADQL